MERGSRLFESSKDEVRCWVEELPDAPDGGEQVESRLQQGAVHDVPEVILPIGARLGADGHCPDYFPAMIERRCDGFPYPSRDQREHGLGCVAYVGEDSLVSLLILASVRGMPGPCHASVSESLEPHQ